jgi:hydroxyisourate hydrolase
VSTLAALNAAPARQAERDLLACCASPRWVATMLAGRPFAGLAEMCALSDAVLAALDWDEVGRALAAHPRIGERAQGTGREADWSRREQSQAATGDAGTQAALTAGNVAYEQRFGQVFLICATGLAAGQILASLRARLSNDEATERGVVRAELTKIVRLRLAKLVGADPVPPVEPAAAAAAVSTHVLDAARGRPAAGVPVRLERQDGDGWRPVARGRTDADGRLGGWAATAGVHRLVFDTGAYLGAEAFYPEVSVTFRVAPDTDRYHVPLLLSPYAYSTYRGS